MKLIALLQTIQAADKIKNAPDNAYLIGVWIGSILPYAVVAGLATFFYYRAKKRND